MRLDRNNLPAVLFPVVLSLAFLSLADRPHAQAPSEAAFAGRPPLPAALERPALLPRAIASFGAARVGRWLYVFGGHIGRAHAHSRENVVGDFLRLDLSATGRFESLPSGPALQGTALVADSRGRLYRVGGVTATNAADEDATMTSTSSVARFDPAVGAWMESTPLPAPRSSHDAIVHEDRLYVVGGWHLAGGEHGTWHSTALVADLREEPPVWRDLPPLGENRRALALAIHAGRLIALGGMDEDGPVSGVRALDISSGTWSDLPELPGMAFGTAAIAMNGELYATVMDGRLLRLTADRGWQAASTLHTPRFFHRLAPGVRDGTVLAIGGASRSGHLRTLEAVEVTRSQPRPTIHEYRLASPTGIDSRQAVVKCGDELWAFGGNRGGDGDRFSTARFADDIWSIDLLTMTAAVRGHLPVRAQSMAAIVAGTRVVLAGGIGVRDDHGVGSLDCVLSLAPTQPQAVACGSRLPMPRTQAELVAHGGKLYLVGGVDFTPDEEGGNVAGDARELLVLDPSAADARFQPSGIHLPRPRRSMAAAVLGDRLYLIGGLGDGFAHAGPCDVFDFATGEWSEFLAPTAWVSAQAAVVAGKIYLACGGTMTGQRFRADPALVEFSPEGGFRTIVAELPFAVRHVHLLEHRGRLLFYTPLDADSGGAVVRLVTLP